MLTNKKLFIDGLHNGGVKSEEVSIPNDVDYYNNNNNNKSFILLHTLQKC